MDLEEAVEHLKFEIDNKMIRRTIFTNQAIEKVLEELEYFKKENEELKEDNLGIREENIKLVNCHISYERYTGQDFLLPDKFKYAIPKDKIRERIKVLKESMQMAKLNNLGRERALCLLMAQSIYARNY